jgi:hypothetical protein
VPTVGRLTDTAHAERCLQNLASALSDRGWPARLEAQAGRVPALYVRNPEAPALSELVYAWPAADRTWWYWWPWGQPIAPAATDTPSAAGMVARVLRSTEGTR